MLPSESDTLVLKNHQELLDEQQAIIEEISSLPDEEREILIPNLERGIQHAIKNREGKKVEIIMDNRLRVDHPATLTFTNASVIDSFASTLDENFAVKRMNRTPLSHDLESTLDFLSRILKASPTQQSLLDLKETFTFNQ
jgi:hypothetical protein